MTRLWTFGVGLTAIALIAVGPAPRAASAPRNPVGTPDDEQQVGEQAFEELKAKAEVIASSPLYDVLTPIAGPITKAAQPLYKHPFKFYLVHEAQPNAFSVPGGNVYVTDALLYFVRNTEELAGTLCHEVAHTISHDSMSLIKKEQQIARAQVGATVLLGPSRAHMLAIGLIGKLQSLGYSRDVESAADLSGADICAASGANPWGLVWLFQDFDKAESGQLPQLLSNHPDNAHRVAALTAHFRGRPAVFGSFSSDPARANRLTAPKNAPVVFLR